MTTGTELPISNRRFKALDGLRGLAAAVVVVHHGLLTWPALDNVTDAGPGVAPGSVPWLLTFSPLHALWAGPEAVYLFFMLSGFVMTLPFLRLNPSPWLAYYPKRLLRLYLPVWASIVLALLTTALVPRTAYAGASEWVAAHAVPSDVLQDALLLNGVGMLNSPLWSIRWEVLFSLLLPAYVLLAIRFRRFWALGIVGLLLAIGAGTVLESVPLIFMPMFGIGVLIALGKDQIRALAERLNQTAWLVLMLFALVLFSAQGTLFFVPGSIVLETVAAIIFTFIFLYWRPAVRFGESKPLQWLGKRSFSLYLIHEPIIVSVSLAGQANNPIPVLLLAVPLSLVTAEGFYRVIEKPSHRLANAVGDKVTSRSGKPVPST